MKVISVIGQQGVGKSVVGKALAERLSAGHIEASQIVSELTGVTKRSQMPETNRRTKEDPSWLARGVHDVMLRNRALQCYVITGIREREVHDYIKFMGTQLIVMTLWAPENLRFGRVRLSGKVKFYRDFQEHGQAELDIGLQSLLDENYPTFVTDYFDVSEVVDNIFDELDVTNWTLAKGQILT